jgi:hypothetical protein
LAVAVEGARLVVFADRAGGVADLPVARAGVRDVGTGRPGTVRDRLLSHTAIPATRSTTAAAGRSSRYPGKEESEVDGAAAGAAGAAAQVTAVGLGDGSVAATT